MDTLQFYGCEDFDVMSRWIGKISFTFRRCAGYLALAAALPFAFPASALEVLSPLQVLALVSIDRPVELRCSDGDCFVELSAFCLQPDYKTPHRGTRYQTVGMGGIRATGYRHDGTPVNLDAMKHFALTALRTHLAVRMSMPAGALNKMNLARVEVTVMESVSLLPMPSNRYEPQNDVSIAVASGPWRKVGDEIVDQDQETMSAVRVTNRIANSLPPFTHVSRQATRALWSDLQNSGTLKGMHPKARQLLEEAYRECEGHDQHGGMTTMRECISHMHDRYLGELNLKYWNVIRGNS